MHERTFRLFQGGIILLGLVLESDALLYFFVALSVFEALTGLRIPVLVTRVKQLATVGKTAPETWPAAKIAFEAERLMRLTVAILLTISFVIFPEETWFFPWFMGAMLVMAGITNVCPMVIYFRWLGFR